MHDYRKAIGRRVRFTPKKSGSGMHSVLENRCNPEFVFYFIFFAFSRSVHESVKRNAKAQTPHAQETLGRKLYSY